MSTKYTAMYFIVFTIVFVLLFMLLAWILQMAYNNSIPEMTKDVETGKEKVAKLGYGNAIALLFLLTFIPSTTIIYSSHLDK